MKVLRVTTVPISLNVLLKGQLKFISDQGFEVIAVSADGPEIKEIKEREGVRHKVVPLTRRITPFQDLIALLRMVLLIRSLKPQMVHSHTPKAGLIGMLAAWLTNTPVRIHTVAGMPLMEAHGISRKLLWLSEAITYRCALKIYPNSNQLKEWILRNFNMPGHKIAVVGHGTSNGIDLDFYRKTGLIEDQASTLKQKLNIAEDRKVLIFVGRLVSEKGIKELVEAFLGLPVDEYQLVLLGDYEDERDPVPHKIKLKIRESPNIHPVGFQQDIRPYLAMADIFVFPSYREGFPNVVLQALAMGLPCIVSNINGCNEVIKDGYNGLIVESKSTKGLKNALQRLLNEYDLLLELRGNARLSVESNYSQKEYWDALLAEYKALLKQHV